MRLGWVALAGIVAVMSAGSASASDTEFFCVKDAETKFDDNTTIACYSDAGCAYAEKLGAYVARDYDVKSVASALGREKIEGIVTTSEPIMKKIKDYGYVCKEAK